MSIAHNPIPKKKYPSTDWKHYKVWQEVYDLLEALPNFFSSEITIKGINVTDIFSVGGLLSTIIEAQIVDILNNLRDKWDEENEYSNYIFVRQSQTFPDILFTNINDNSDILFGIELKAWYVFSKESEPSFRYTITPNACAKPDLLVVIPWLLSDVISGSPRLLFPYIELGKYVAEFRNHYWINSRMSSGKSSIIKPPPSIYQHPYPKSKDEASDKAEADKGNNFGRIARAGIMDEYVRKIRAIDYLGIKIIHWIKFFKAISENKTDDEISKKLDSILRKINQELAHSQTVSDKQLLLKGIADKLAELQNKI